MGRKIHVIMFDGGWHFEASFDTVEEAIQYVKNAHHIYGWDYDMRVIEVLYRAGQD